MLFKRGRDSGIDDAIAGGPDAENGTSGNEAFQNLKSALSAQNRAVDNIIPSTDIFTWRNVCYDVQIKGVGRRLLSDVSGYVVPGRMTARTFPSRFLPSQSLPSLAPPAQVSPAIETDIFQFAVMGESGAGKTTLLNVLAQRTDVGVVSGDMLVNGKLLPNSFQRQTGSFSSRLLLDATV